MKKLTCLLLLTSMMLVCFAGCGGTELIPPDTASKPEDPVTDAPNTDTTETRSTDTQPTETDMPDTTAEPQRSVCIKVLTPDSRIAEPDDYELSGLYTDILTDRSVRNGWFYSYSTGTEPRVPWEEWKCAAGMYTSCELIFDLTNLAEKMTVSFPARFRGAIIYRVDVSGITGCETADEFFAELEKRTTGTSGAEFCPMTPLQHNPGQIDLDGYETRSKDGVLLAKNATARQDLIADISETFLRDWEDPASNEPMWAVFCYRDDTVYLVDMRTYLEEAAD